MELRDTVRTCRLFSGSYDYIFGPVFHPGRKEAVRVANDRPGQRILEAGVGTGLSLPFFRPDAEVVGIDVSEEMLVQARRHLAPLATQGVLTSDVDALASVVATRTRRDEAADVAGMTKSELRVLRLLPTHRSLGEMGDALGVSRNTVKSQVAAIYRKLEVGNRAEAVRRAQELGLLPS